MKINFNDWINDDTIDDIFWHLNYYDHGSFGDIFLTKSMKIENEIKINYYLNFNEVENNNSFSFNDISNKKINLFDNFMLSFNDIYYFIKNNNSLTISDLSDDVIIDFIDHCDISIDFNLYKIKKILKLI